MLEPLSFLRFWFERLRFQCCGIVKEDGSMTLSDYEKLSAPRVLIKCVIIQLAVPYPLEKIY